MAGSYYYNYSCTPFTTPSNETVARYEAAFTFNSILSDSERNNLLCYITSATLANESMLHNRATEACDNSTEATAPKQTYYKYNGKTEFTANDTIFLVVYDNSSSSQTSIQNFKALFATNGSLTANSVNYINQTINNKLLTGLYIGNNSYISSRSSNATVTVLAPLLNQTSGYINVTNVTMSKPGQIFFGVGYINATKPSQEQIMNCQDGAATTLLNCTRLIIPTGGRVNFRVYLD